MSIIPNDSGHLNSEFQGVREGRGGFFQPLRMYQGLEKRSSDVGRILENAFRWCIKF